jgi:hypothetical protein
MGIRDIIISATSIVSTILIPIAFALCLLYFFWGIAKYIGIFAGSDKAEEEGKRVMVWGVVGLFVVSSIWGIIAFVTSEIQLPQNDVVYPMRR